MKKTERKLLICALCLGLLVCLAAGRLYWVEQRRQARQQDADRHLDASHTLAETKRQEEQAAFEALEPSNDPLLLETLRSFPLSERIMLAYEDGQIRSRVDFYVYPGLGDNIMAQLSQMTLSDRPLPDVAWPEAYTEFSQGRYYTFTGSSMIYMPSTHSHLTVRADTGEILGWADLPYQRSWAYFTVPDPEALVEALEHYAEFFKDR